MGALGGVRGAGRPGGWLSARGWCAVAVAVGMPLVTAAAHAPVAVRCRVTRTISMPSTPDEVAVDPATRTLYVTDDFEGTVSVIDTATGTVTRTIPVGSSPDGVAVDPATRTVYVANSAYRTVYQPARGAGTVSVIDGTTGMVTATIGVGEVPDAVAVDSAAGTAYVTNWGNDTVSVIGRCGGLSRGSPRTGQHR